MWSACRVTALSQDRLSSGRCGSGVSARQGRISLTCCFITSRRTPTLTWGEWCVFVVIITPVFSHVSCLLVGFNHHMLVGFSRPLVGLFQLLCSACFSQCLVEVCLGWFLFSVCWLVFIQCVLVSFSQHMLIGFIHTICADWFQSACVGWFQSACVVWFKSACVGWFQSLCIGWFQSLCVGWFQSQCVGWFQSLCVGWFQ